MKRNILVITLLVALFPLTAMSQQNNVGSCGWGSKLFDGQRGIAPQVLAATTNGTSGNQTFAVTSGTSGCTQDGMVKSTWKTAAYMDANMTKVARDMSRGQGESLDSLALLIGVKAEHKDLFTTALKANFGSIFTSKDSSSAEVLASIKAVLSQDATLSQYAANL